MSGAASGGGGGIAAAAGARIRWVTGLWGIWIFWAAAPGAGGAGSGPPRWDHPLVAGSRGGLAVLRSASAQFVMRPRRETEFPAACAGCGPLLARRQVL